MEIAEFNLKVKEAIIQLEYLSNVKVETEYDWEEKELEENLEQIEEALEILKSLI